MYCTGVIMKEVLTIFVRIEQTISVEGQAGSAAIVLFSGYAESEYFRGNILPGAADCQKSNATGFVLSARYILEGLDCAGKHCKIFIENNGSPDETGMIRTKPIVYTDSDSLKWLEHAILEGHISEEKGTVIIHISIKEENF